MDKRDTYNVVHMRRRLTVASRYSLARQIRCAHHLVRIAELQHRFHLLALAHMWEEQLKKEEVDNAA